MYRVRLQDSYFTAVADAKIPDHPIGDALRRAADEGPEVIALKEATSAGEIRRVWTYDSLCSCSLRLARALLSRHVPGDRIGIWAPNIPEWVLLEYAAALAGITIVTVNPSFRAWELKYVLEQSRATALYLVPEVRGNLLAQIAATVCAELPAIRHVIDMTNADLLFAGEHGDTPLPKVAAEAPVQVQYTSGTTGFPKGAVLTHRGLYGNASLLAQRVAIRPGATWLNFMPMFHTGGCSLMTLGPLSTRDTVIITPLFDGAVMNAIIERERVEVVLAVPTMIVGMLEAQIARPRDLSSLKVLLSGGAVVAPELIRQAQGAFRECSIHVMYGQTEASPVITTVWPDASVEDIAETAGQPLSNVEVSIRDTVTNEVLPLAQSGEICARSFMNMLGYHDNAEASRHTLDEEGWLHTGDLGTLDNRGVLRVTGRIKDMIIRGGENLFPAEIENALLEHPSLAEVAVVGLPDPKFGEIVACFMRTRDGSRPGRDELTTFCRQRLSSQKTPAVWVIVEEWPLTPSGKVQKFLLREQYLQGKHSQGQVVR